MTSTVVNHGINVIMTIPILIMEHFQFTQANKCWSDSKHHSRKLTEIIHIGIKEEELAAGKKYKYDAEVLFASSQIKHLKYKILFC